MSTKPHERKEETQTPWCSSDVRTGEGRGFSRTRPVQLTTDPLPQTWRPQNNHHRQLLRVIIRPSRRRAIALQVALEPSLHALGVNLTYNRSSIIHRRIFAPLLRRWGRHLGSQARCSRRRWFASGVNGAREMKAGSLPFASWTCSSCTLR